MWLEDYSPEIESSDGLWQSIESTKETSEKYNESSRKAWAKVAKVWKDEKKAKKYDFLLAWFMVKIIVDKKYDFILESLFNSIHIWYPSNFILWILSIINIDISNKIREVSNKQLINFKYSIKNDIEIFDDKNINFKIKERINYWIEDIMDSVILEYSNIQTEKLKQLLIIEEKILLEYISNIFSFFLDEINIKISKNKSESISTFIILEVKKSIDKLILEDI